MKGTYEDIIKALKCSAENYSDFCKDHSCERKLKGKPLCPYRQSVYQGTAYNPRLYKDAAELLERCREISKLYRQKCEEVNKLRDLVSGKFDPDRYVEFYNSLIGKEGEKYTEPIEPHENI